MKVSDNWNYERWRTRDRLLDYDFSIVPAMPHSAGLSMIYPWETVQLSQLSYQFFTLAQQHGYTGTEEYLWKQFSEGNIISSTIDNFPVPGDEHNLYLDKETGILYYFKAARTDIDPIVAAKIGIAIVGHSLVDDVYYLYIPISALLIEDIILNCGDAAEYID